MTCKQSTVHKTPPLTCCWPRDHTDTFEIFLGQLTSKLILIGIIYIWEIKNSWNLYLRPFLQLWQVTLPWSHITLIRIDCIWWRREPTVCPVYGLNERSPESNCKGWSKETVFLLHVNWSCLDSCHYKQCLQELLEEPSNHPRPSMPA